MILKSWNLSKLKLMNGVTSFLEKVRSALAMAMTEKRRTQTWKFILISILILSSILKLKLLLSSKKEWLWIGNIFSPFYSWSVFWWNFICSKMYSSTDRWNLKESDSIFRWRISLMEHCNSEIIKPLSFK